MASYQLTSKGQVTIPKAMREAIGLRPGSAVTFTRDGDALIVRRVEEGERERGMALVDRLRSARPHVHMSTAELMAMTRGDE